MVDDAKFGMYAKDGLIAAGSVVLAKGLAVTGSTLGAMADGQVELPTPEMPAAQEAAYSIIDKRYATQPTGKFNTYSDEEAARLYKEDQARRAKPGKITAPTETIIETPIATTVALTESQKARQAGKKIWTPEEQRIWDEEEQAWNKSKAGNRVQSDKPDEPVITTAQKGNPNEQEGAAGQSPSNEEQKRRAIDDYRSEIDAVDKKNQQKLQAAQTHNALHDTGENTGNGLGYGLGAGFGITVLGKRWIDRAKAQQKSVMEV